MVSEEELTLLKCKFVLLLSADYQMNKLVPHWGLSPQPGSTYYLQKFNHDVLGIVNHAEKTIDERVGQKNTDHAVSYISNSLCESSLVPAWVRKINACSSSSMLGWAS